MSEAHSRLIRAFPGPEETTDHNMSAVCWINHKGMYKGKEEHVWVLYNLYESAHSTSWYCSRCRRVEIWTHVALGSDGDDDG